MNKSFIASVAFLFLLVDADGKEIKDFQVSNNTDHSIRVQFGANEFVVEDIQSHGPNTYPSFSLDGMDDDTYAFIVTYKKFGWIVTAEKQNNGFVVCDHQDFIYKMSDDLLKSVQKIYGVEDLWFDQRSIEYESGNDFLFSASIQSNRDCFEASVTLKWKNGNFEIDAIVVEKSETPASDQ